MSQPASDDVFWAERAAPLVAALAAGPLTLKQLPRCDDRLDALAWLDLRGLVAREDGKWRLVGVPDAVPAPMPVEPEPDRERVAPPKPPRLPRAVKIKAPRPTRRPAPPRRVLPIQQRPEKCAAVAGSKGMPCYRRRLLGSDVCVVHARQARP